jgi:hypothetical protein
MVNGLPPEPLKYGTALGATYYDVGMPARSAVWGRIRAMRWQPPGRASKGDRRNVFSSALEQAEQLYTAASTVGYSSRPMLLFYGLSQAGRAIAAATDSAKGSDEWRLSKHGIQVPDIAEHPPLHSLKVSDQGSGSFTQLARILQSGSLPKGTPLGQLWSLIPELRNDPLANGSAEYLLPLRYERYNLTLGMVFGSIQGMPLRFAESATDDEVSAYLSAYPSLSSAKTSTAFTYDGRPDGTERTAEVPRCWEMDGYDSPELLESRLTQPYRGDNDRWIFPALGGDAAPLHPLLAWWGVLFALSMLARYEPADWTKCLAIDASPNAKPLETVLDKALDLCPQLVYQAIGAVSS